MLEKELRRGDGLAVACSAAAVSAEAGGPLAELDSPLWLLAEMMHSPGDGTVVPHGDTAAVLAEIARRRALGRCIGVDPHHALDERDVDLSDARDRIKSELYAEYGPRIDALYAEQAERRRRGEEEASPLRMPVVELQTELRTQMRELQQQSCALLQRELRESRAPLEEIEGRLNLLLGIEQGMAPPMIDGPTRPVCVAPPAAER